MTIDAVELRKIQYAQELAAYTMRQWMLMREDIERKRGVEPASANEPVPPTQNSNPRASRRTRDDVNSSMYLSRQTCVQLVDFTFSTSRTACRRPYRVLGPQLRPRAILMTNRRISSAFPPISSSALSPRCVTFHQYIGSSYITLCLPVALDATSICYPPRLASTPTFIVPI
jgi:hypothetical protein